MPLLKKLRGTIESIFQIGISGPNLKNNGGVIEGRNNADSAFAVMRGASPLGDSDLVTKLYADTLEKPLIVGRQADTSVSLPNNTAVRGFVVVTTAGSGAVIGDVLFDNGLNDAAPMTILAAVEGRTLAITDALSGGTVTFDADSLYIWDADNTLWVKIGDIGSVTGAVRTIRYLITNAASQDSTFAIPANQQVLKTNLEITTPYSGGASISIGTTAVAAAFQATTDNNPQATAGRVYSVEQDTDVGGANTVVRTTIAGAPAVGAGIVTVWFTNPNG